MEAGEGDLGENRFSYLLQPIRDLAANWDINIAGELEEYLDELEHITFTIEGSGGSTLNFAEAALLIQVSVGVEPVPGSSSSGLYIALDARHLRQASVRIVKADMQ